MIECRLRLSIAALVAACGFLSACGDDGTAVCPGGDDVTIEGHALCLYEASVVIETGWHCPAARPNFYEVDGNGVCSAEEDLEQGVLDAADQRFDQQIGGPDAGVDVGFDLPGDGGDGSGEPPVLQVQITWDARPGIGIDDLVGGHDIDLHLLRIAEGAEFFEAPADCHSPNPEPDWGESGPGLNDCDLVTTNIDGVGLEDAYVYAMEAGVTYRVGVHFFDVGTGNAGASSDANFDITININELTVHARNNEHLTEPKTFCELVDVTWPGVGSSVVVDQIGSCRIEDR